MTNEERVQKIQAGENVAENLERLFYDNIGLWKFAIDRYAAHADYEELLQEAFLAVAKAAKHYKPELGAFSSFAVLIIRREIPVYLSTYHAFAIPEWWITVQGKFADLTREGITNEKELSRRLGVSVEKVKILKRSVISANSPAFLDEEQQEIIDTIPAPEDTEADAMEIVGNEVLRREVWEEVGQYVTGKKLEILKAVFQDGYSISAVAERFGCSPQYISAVNIWALHRLEKSEKLRELALDYDYITRFFFRGGLRNWKHTFTSSVEKYVLEREKLNKRRLRIIMQYYQEAEKEKEINAEFEMLMAKYKGGKTAPAQ